MWMILIASAMIGYGVAGMDGLVYGPMIGFAVMLVMYWISKLAPNDHDRMRK